MKNRSALEAGLRVRAAWNEIQYLDKAIEKIEVAESNDGPPLFLKKQKRTPGRAIMLLSHLTLKKETRTRLRESDFFKGRLGLSPEKCEPAEPRIHWVQS